MNIARCIKLVVQEVLGVSKRCGLLLIKESLWRNEHVQAIARLKRKSYRVPSRCRYTSTFENYKLIKREAN